MSATVYARFRAAAHADWEAAVTHRFVRELVTDTLPDDVLRDYLVQDNQFSFDFLSLLGQALASADTMSAKTRLAHQLGFIANDENAYFQERFVQFAVPQGEIDHPELAPASAGFRELYQSAVASRSYADALIVLTVAEALYLDWAERATDHGTRMPALPQNRGWIDVHRGDDFTEWVDFLIAELNRVADPDDSEQRDRFRLAVHLELGFFDDAYAGRD
jgi:thiaminase/transcriptional activator TenA